MKKEKHEKTTVTVRLTDEEDQVLSRLCMLKKTSKTGYLARLAKDRAKAELLNYAAGEYVEGKASLSELAKKTGLDVPAIMDEVREALSRPKFAPRIAALNTSMGELMESLLNIVG